MKNVFITGGAGYIGSHCAISLFKNGYNPIILDNFSNSRSSVIKNLEIITDKKITFYDVDIRDKKKLISIFKKISCYAVIHCAGLKSVAESIRRPIDYFDNNIGSTLSLLECMRKSNVFKLIFSSSATVYDNNQLLPLKETNKTGNIKNPYGNTKYIIERILMDLVKSDYRWSIRIARYFNPISNHSTGLIMENPKGIPNNLSLKKSLSDFNSKSDEIYFEYYDNYSGYFSSNRSNEINNYCDSCCTNIFTFKIPKIIQPIDPSSLYSEFLPLNLYFDNDSPNIDSFNFSPVNYKESYINYFMKVDEYSNYSSKNSLFFEDSLKGNFNQLNKLLHKLHHDLESGYFIDIKIKGYSSQLADSTYNIELSSVRIKSLISYFLSFQNGFLAQFYYDNQLKINEVPLGESQIKSQATQNIKKGIYGIDAILNRKVSVLKIDRYK